ncbi:MAG: hypothetical protein IJP76_04595 [Paludibacteraceae bacterium]|nr:hypothetical protein [Paludibacteraceae bacterium]
MKKMTFFALAAVMLSAVVLTGCKNDENEPSKKAASVSTDITLSLPTQVDGGMRHMPGVNVQTSGATDFATNGMKAITLVPFAPSAAITTSSVRHGDNIVLGVIGSTYANETGKGRTKVFEAQQVPTGTSAFLFYGESNTNESNKFKKGSLTGSLAGEPTAFTFALEPINANASTIEADAAYTGLIAYLNAVANATDGTKAWKNYTAGDNEGFYELFRAYSSATVLSSFGIRRMMTDLYKNLKLNTTDALASAIRDSIARPEYATVNTTTGEVTLVAGLQNFPHKFNLPDGAVAVAYNAGTGLFAGNAAHAYGVLAPAQIDRYVYPPSLWYFANTKIKTSNASEKEHYAEGASWASILGQYPNDNSSVNAKTRSIALKDTIQYAVARLDVQVKLKEGTNLEDNDLVTANNKVVNPALGYPVSAVLIGGQKNVGFDFTPATYAGSATYAYTVYDTVMTAAMYATPSAYSATNSTLVMETAASENEYICVEFTNTSAKDFYGADGIVPIGGKFYLVGQLNAALATQTDSKVFKQDYTTIVRLSVKDLKNAYNTIPDLKAPQLEIGMLVDLTWKAGHTYEIDFD